ncbi:MAG: ORF6N domain-containing protein [Deltaproteobacteria bacterium]|nr:ORF6N domain-containing protein [Deltaproteobacteria bacterium]MBW2341265.1 ORF6N domain-containing protein [Deltaproteobacteria bacterium]
MRYWKNSGRPSDYARDRQDIPKFQEAPISWGNGVSPWHWTLVSKRFPSDFVFQLDQDEFDSLRSQIVISKGKDGRRYLPHAFTEQGVPMLSSVLRSKRAIQLNVAIMPNFVKLREIIATHKYRDKLKLQKKGVMHDPLTGKARFRI